MNKKINVSFLAGVLLFTVIFMNVSNKNISSNGYFLEKKKDESIDVKCEDFDDKNELDSLNNFKEKFQKKLDNLDNVNVENVEIENGKKDKKDVDVDKNNVDKNKDKDKNDLVKFVATDTAAEEDDFWTKVNDFFDDFSYYHEEMTWELFFSDLYTNLKRLFALVGFCVFLCALCAFAAKLNRSFREWCENDVGIPCEHSSYEESQYSLLSDDDGRSETSSSQLEISEDYEIK